jgi:hypothetical protein
MITITAQKRQDIELVKEALNHYGFQYHVGVTKKYRFFGPPVFKLKMYFFPSIEFMEELVKKAIDVDDFENAERIRRVIFARKNQIQ